MPKPPAKEIHLIMAVPPTSPTLRDAEPDEDLGEGGSYPTVFLPSAPGAPSNLKPGYEGSASFRFRVTDRTDDGGLELELLGMTPDDAPAPPSPRMGQDEMDKHWRDAEDAAS